MVNVSTRKRVIFAIFRKDGQINKKLINNANKNKNEPVKKSINRIAEIIKLQIILKLERYGTSKLSKRYKLEFELYFDIFDWVLGLIFDILRKKDPKKTEGLKISMISLFSKNNK